MSSRERIEQNLAVLRRAWHRAEMVEKSTYLGAALVVVVGLAVGLAHMGAVKLGVTFVLGSCLLALVGGVVFGLRSAAVAAHRQMAMARLAEELAPELGSGPSSAVDLARRLDRASDVFSRELAQAHVDATAEALQRARLGSRLKEARRRRQRITLMVVAGSALFTATMLVTLSTGRSRLWAWVRNPIVARVSGAPLAGDIKLTYRYPVYTGLPPRVVEGGDGGIAAVVGTQVDIEAVADTEARSGFLRIVDGKGEGTQDVPMTAEGRKLRASLSVLRDGRYTFEIVDKDGDRIKDGASHPIRAVPDASPEIAIDVPSADVVLKDDRHVDILWRASDDFGLGEVNLVVVRDAKEVARVQLATAGKRVEQRREGDYRWSILGLNLLPGVEVRFHLEAIDNDAITGPKKAVSEARRLVIFSARQRHGELLEQQRALIDGIVDLLAEELVSPFPKDLDANVTPLKDKQLAIAERMAKLAAELEDFTDALREDDLSGNEVVAAFSNVAEHIREAQQQRTQHVQRLANAATAAVRKSLAERQASDVKQLERDLIYLDDLLAMQRINQLKETAKDLLAAQRKLQDLLQQYVKTKDPALKDELQRRIADLKEQMLGLLARMSEVRQGLPAEYRNLESASVLQLDDQLERLDRMLRDGDVDSAATELSQLSNMVENMVKGIDEAEDEFGGDRYAGLRQQLAEFGDQFTTLEADQKFLAERTEQLLSEYRKRAVQQAGRNLEDVVKSARAKTQLAIKATDEVSQATPLLHEDIKTAVETARERLVDLDSLIQQGDFSEARQASALAEDAVDELHEQLGERPPPGAKREWKAQQAQGERESNKALGAVKEVNQMLDRLFPDPNSVLTKEQLLQMQRNTRRQQQLAQNAQVLEQRMDELSKELPLFGGEPRQALVGARTEMERAVGQMQGGKLAPGSSHTRRAAEALTKLRKKLEESAQGAKGGMPMPLGSSGSGQGEDEGGKGGGGSFNQRDIDIPQVDNSRATPRFRKELLEAAKQKAPAHYEEAVRRYYEELIK